MCFQADELLMVTDLLLFFLFFKKMLSSDFNYFSSPLHQAGSSRKLLVCFETTPKGDGKLLLSRPATMLHFFWSRLTVPVLLRERTKSRSEGLSLQNKIWSSHSIAERLLLAAEELRG